MFGLGEACVDCGAPAEPTAFPPKVFVCKKDAISRLTRALLLGRKVEA